MSVDAEAPKPRRLSRPRWLDPRVVGGVILVVIAVVAGARVIGASRQTSPVLVAARDLSGGTVLTAADVVTVEVNLGEGLGRYLAAGSAVEGRTVVEPLRAGELVPVSAIGDPLTGRIMVIAVAPDQMPPGVAHGSIIDLYLTRGSGAAASTERLAEQLTVQSVAAPASGGLSGASANQYQLAVLLTAERADTLIRTLPAGQPRILLVAGPPK